MKRPHTLLTLLAGILTLLLSAFGCGKPPLTWKDVDLGSPQMSGTHSLAKGILTITGAGEVDESKGTEQGHFTYTSLPGGDFDITMRVTSLEASPNAQVGILARSVNEGLPSTAQVTYTAKDSKTGQGFLRWKATDPNALTAKNARGGIDTLREPPAMWLRMVRMGKLFAVYKSGDGKLWSALSNTSGGKFTAEGPIELGFIVSSGDKEKTVTATIDHIVIGKPDLGYKTSWVGNTFGATPLDRHVSNGLTAMWVAPDGTCCTTSIWDEAGVPSALYRAGKPMGKLPGGAAYEGGITGDGKSVYVASVDYIIKLNLGGDVAQGSGTKLVLSVPLKDPKSSTLTVSGMAANEHELFVADSRANLIRVVTLDPLDSLYKATAANLGTVLAPGRVEVPLNDSFFAPAEVYQSQRSGEGFQYTIPGMTPGAAYTLRLHLAAYKDLPPTADPAGRLLNIGVSGRNEPLDVAKLAGGALKAFVKDYPEVKPDEKGNIVFAVGGRASALCGFEILDATGKRCFAVNSGGPETGDFKGECLELVKRAFPFERPGAMTLDKRGDLWIIQRGNDFPAPVTVGTKYKAAIKCYKTDGTFTGREITDVVNPTCLAYDEAHDQLLVGENGPDLNVRFYADLDKAPKLAKTFGEKDGIYSGGQPGLVNDPAAGGFARFQGISGVGVDAKGNLYVGGGFSGTDLRMFTPDGKLGWMLNSQVFCCTYDVDPDSDGSDIYAVYNHLKLDLSQKEPGKEQKFIGYNWDVRNFGPPERAGSSQAILRRLGPDRSLVMFTSGQGLVGDINIYRYEGEIAIPCGGTRDKGKSLWIDANGNGKEDPDEIVKMETPIGYVTSLCVDSKGDMWASVPGSFMRHFFFKGVNEKGVPIYSGAKGEGYEDVRFPEEGEKTSGWGMVCKADYDADRDIMVVFYPAAARKGEKDYLPPYFFARYDNWSKGNRKPKWKVKAFDPAANPAYFMYEKTIGPYNLPDLYMGMQVAGDFVFMADVWGQVHVFDLKSGQLLKILAVGPEVAGFTAWEDAAMGLRAFKCKNGEYLIFTENSGWGGKNNFFRWKP